MDPSDARREYTEHSVHLYNKLALGKPERLAYWLERNGTLHDATKLGLIPAYSEEALAVYRAQMEAAGQRSAALLREADEAGVFDE